MYLKLISFILLLLIVYAINALECFDSFNVRTNTCSHTNNHSFTDSEEECCKLSTSAAYSSVKPTEDKAVLCTPCKQFHKRKHYVYCFHELYYAGERSCELLHRYLATIEDCCIHRGRGQNKRSQGFFKELIKRDAKIPTYECTPCSEVVTEANHWTSWSECNSKCGSGYRYREKICQFEIPTKICNGEDKVHESCIVRDCEPKSFLSSKYIVFFIIACLLAFVLTVIVCICFVRKIREQNYRESLKAAAVSDRRPTVPQIEPRLQHTLPSSSPTTPRFHRQLPPTPSEERRSETVPINPKRANNEKPITYAEMDVKPDYVSMNVKENE